MTTAAHPLRKRCLPDHPTGSGKLATAWFRMARPELPADRRWPQ